ncbi:MAG: alpha/beta hydrolase, partial [Verrucomicrobiota bacterium]
PEGSLTAHFLTPPHHNPKNDHRPCIVFFHGGLWDTSMATQFVPHCHHFTTRGAVTLTVEYRVSSKHNTGPIEAYTDARATLRFLAQNAQSIGLDLTKIVMVGGASGAHLVLSCATLLENNESNPIPRPAAVIGYSSIVDCTKKGIGLASFPSPKEAKHHSPLYQLPKKDLPPCLLFHAKEDRIASFERISKFTRQYNKKGNTCELIDYEGVGHTFYNYNTNRELYELSLRALDHFLVDQNILEPSPFDDF